MPLSPYHFLWSVDHEIEVKNLMWHINKKDIMGNMCTKFQVDWSSTLSQKLL